MMRKHQALTIATIQALRAFAVSWVVIDHVFPHLLPGGYIGVDVFFVISGRLITAHLLSQIESDDFDFGRFYLRRAQRLLPAALTVLVATAIASIVLLPSAWLGSSLSGIGAAAIYGVNWWLAGNSVDYFADGGIVSPVNHFWSLSVEEQFYIGWPALLFIGWQISRRSTRKDPRIAFARIVFAILVIVIILSLLIATASVVRAPAETYFFTHTRLWEFAFGGLAALAVRREPPLLWGLLSRSIFIVAWAVLIASGWLLNPGSGVPGPIILPVVLATSLLLVIGDDHNSDIARKIIAFRPVQWLGNISYSVYLWHWPILVFAPFVLGVEHISDSQRLAILLATLGLSHLSWRHLETRFQVRGLRDVQDDRKFSSWLRVSAFVTLSLLIAGLAAGAAHWQEGRAVSVANRLYDLSIDPGPCFGARSTEPGANCPDTHRLADKDFALQNWTTQILRLPNGESCQNEPGDATVRACTFGTPEGQARNHIALFGDSHAGMWAAALGQFAEEDHIRVSTYLGSSCPATDDNQAFATYLRPEFRQACIAWRKEATAAILSDLSIDTVVVSGNAYMMKIWTGDGWAEDDGHGFSDLWRRIRSAGKRIVVIDDVPMLPWKLPDCLARAQPKDDPCTYARTELPVETPLARAVKQLPKDVVDYVSFTDVFCTRTTCHSVIGGIPAYMDSDHISAPMSRSLSGRIRAVLEPGRRQKSGE